MCIENLEKRVKPHLPLAKVAASCMLLVASFFKGCPPMAVMLFLTLILKYPTLVNNEVWFRKRKKADTNDGREDTQNRT